MNKWRIETGEEEVLSQSNGMAVRDGSASEDVYSRVDARMSTHE